MKETDFSKMYPPEFPIQMESDPHISFKGTVTQTACLIHRDKEWLENSPLKRNYNHLVQNSML